MKTHDLPIETIKTPDELVKFLKEKNLSEGDTIHLLLGKLDPVAGTLVFLAAALSYYFRFEKKKHQDEGGKMIDDLFKEKTVEEIETQIENDYGVKLEVEQRDSDREDFLELSAQAFEQEYGDEPDYSNVPIIEINPDYNPWKKGR